MTSVMLSKDARLHLASALQKFVRWDSGSVVRLLTTDRESGIYADAPMGVLVFIAVPLAEPPEQTLDRPVSAHRLRDVLGELASPADDPGPVPVRLPDARDMPPALAAIPSRDGWIPAEKATAAEVATAVDTALDDLQRATDAESDDASKRVVAERWWDTPSWGGMPLKALHAAKSLGMLAHPGARIESATRAGWKRLQSPAGQVFVAPPASYAGIPLSVVK